MSTDVINMQTDGQKPTPAKRGFEDSLLWQIKLRLQFSGWLLYLAHAFIVVVLLIIAGIGWLIGYWPLLLVSLPLGLAAFFFVALVGTIVMVRYGLHPAERLPRPKTDLDVFELMRARRSCRSFQRRNLTEEHRTELLDVAQTQNSPEFLIGDHPIRFEYVSAPLTVWPVVGAREFLVAVAPKTYHRIAVIDVGRSLQKTRFTCHANGSRDLLDRARGRSRQCLETSRGSFRPIAGSRDLCLRNRLRIHVQAPCSPGHAAVTAPTPAFVRALF